MQAPQLRLNERQANPNPYIIFIRSLQRKKDHTDAEDILKAVAAQMKPIMNHRFMQVHTLEEAEFNRVFAGRNWNHGQSIELVLRGPTGRFLPMQYIISVMCHEMAHIEQMNHGPKFQKLMADIKADVARLQSKGYHGDGFWSDGKRLADSVRMGGEGLCASDFPEYVCGVSAADARKAKRPSRGPGASKGPALVKGEASHRSGRQTEYRRKAGQRNAADMGEGGSRLDGGRRITKEDTEARKAFVESQTQALIRSGMPPTRAAKNAAKRWEVENPWWKEGSTRGKVAKSKTAAELRAAAAEARLRALSGPSTSTDSKPLVCFEHDDAEDDAGGDDDDVNPYFDEEDEVEDPHIDATERRKEMEEEMDDEEREGLRGGWEEYVSGGAGASEQALTKPTARKRDLSPDAVPGPASSSKRKTTPAMPSFGPNLVRLERLRALGLAKEGAHSTRQRTLGASPAYPSEVKPELRSDDDPKNGLTPRRHVVREDGRPGWTCKICTYANLADQGRCEMCQARPDGTVPPDVIV